MVKEEIFSTKSILNIGYIRHSCYTSLLVVEVLTRRTYMEFLPIKKNKQGGTTRYMFAVITMKVEIMRSNNK